MPCTSAQASEGAQQQPVCKKFSAVRRRIKAHSCAAMREKRAEAEEQRRASAYQQHDAALSPLAQEAVARMLAEEDD